MKQLNLLTLIRKNAFFLIPIIVLFAMLGIYSFNLLFIIISVILTYKIFSPLLNKKNFDSLIIKGVSIFFIFIIILQCVILSSWLINSNFPLDATPTLTLLIMTIAYIYRHFLPKPRISKLTLPIKKAPFIRLSDIISIAIAIAIVLPLSLSLLTHDGKDMQNNVTTLAGGADDTAHLKLVDDRLQFNRGILYRSDAIEQVKTGDSYPAGWHSANAVIIKAIYPKISAGDESLVAYALSKVFWFLALVFIFCRIILILYEFLCNRKPSLPAILWLASGSLLFSRFFLVDTFRTGFYSFMPQLIAALLLVPILIQFSLQNNKRKACQETLLLLSVMCIGGCLSWFLVLPAFLLIIILILFDHLKNTNKRRFIKDMTSGILDNLPFYGLLLTATAVQLYVMLTNHVAGSVSFIQGVLINGGINTYKGEFYIFIFIGFALCLFFTCKSSEKILRYILYAILSLLIFAGIISAIQIMYLGTNAYYYYKVLYILTVIALPVGLVGIASSIDWIEKNKSKSIALTTSLILILIIVQLFS